MTVMILALGNAPVCQWDLILTFLRLLSSLQRSEQHPRLPPCAKGSEYLDNPCLCSTSEDGLMLN